MNDFNQLIRHIRIERTGDSSGDRLMAIRSTFSRARGAFYEISHSLLSREISGCQQ
ncbi:hypothetical protein [Afipia felis]|uniref:hypothetical protein n=1 Tax=Afipia felis TaxID=1035 RepID=UPI000AC33E78|nr:hypothetical protein [Afipia felis]